MFIELHILQNFAPSCLNRDDTNAPKDCEFGGFRRARISSQCIKRSIRTYWLQSEDEEMRQLVGKRTADLVDWLTDEFLRKQKNTPRDIVRTVAQALVKALYVKKGKESKRTGRFITSYLVFLGHDEMQALLGYLEENYQALTGAAKKAAEAKAEESDRGEPDEEEEKEDKSPLGKAVKALLKEKPIKGGGISADIALFGRMVADFPGVNVDAACQVAHAISTNEVDMEMDFYTAVDDLQKKGEETGAGFMGIVEFNSSCFYRYALLDTEQLKKNLPGDKGLAKAAVLAFVKAAVFAIPTGKQNSMAAQNLPLYVRVVAREGAAPRSLANAFLKPVRTSRQKDDLVLSSVEALEAHDKSLNRMYGTGGMKLDVASSVYEGRGGDDIDGLLGKLGGIL